jgi:hypothetical protein
MEDNSDDLKEILSTEDVEKMNNMSPASKINYLRDIAKEMTSNPILASIERKIVFLMETERRNNPLETATPIVMPDEYDVLISDIRETDFVDIGSELGVQRLTRTEKSKAFFPVDGIMFGGSTRIFIPLIVTKREASIVVIFLFDTGSPNSYLRTDTLSALGFIENTPGSTNVDIHGTSVNVHHSQGHFENVDLLGQDFMRGAGIEAILRYSSMSVTFLKEP